MTIQPTLQYTVPYPERLSRLLIFVKWLLIIPHLLVLYVLGIAMAVIWLIAWFAILITGQYPRSLFDFFNGCLRWNYRVLVYSMLLTDSYLPFSFEQTPSPAQDGAMRPAF
jgi:hypothetical protein